jgi:hypothetical protein
MRGESNTETSEIDRGLYNEKGFEVTKDGIPIHYEPLTLEDFVSNWLYKNPEVDKKLESHYEKSHTPHPDKLLHHGFHPRHENESMIDWVTRIVAAGYRDVNEYYELIEKSTRECGPWRTDCDEWKINYMLEHSPEMQKDWIELFKERRHHAKNSQFKN